MMEEIWKEVNYYPKYSVSNLGNVKRNKDNKILKQYPQKNGYVYVWLNRASGTSSIPVHRIVCIAFHGEEGYIQGMYVDHINTNRSDNRAENLRWVTPKENSNNPITLENMSRAQKNKRKKDLVD